MTLDTIGHVGRRPDDFEGLLVQHSVRSVADYLRNVTPRSTPWSLMYPRMRR